MSSDHNTARYGWTDCVYLLKSRWPVLFLVCSVVLVSGAVIRMRTPQLYEAGAVVNIAAGPEQQNRIVPQDSSAVRSIAEGGVQSAWDDLTSFPILREIAQDLKLSERWKRDSEARTVMLLRSRIAVEKGKDSNRIRILAMDRTPKTAAELSNRLAAQYVDWKNSREKIRVVERARSLAEEVGAQNKRIDEIEQKLVELNEQNTASETELGELRKELVSESHLLRSLEAKSQLATVESLQPAIVATVTEEAVAEDASLSGNLWATFAGLLILGLSLGSVIVVATGYRRADLKVAIHLSRKLDIPVVELAPVSGRSLVGQVDPEAYMIEPYRLMRTRIHRLQAPDCMVVTCLAGSKCADSAEAVTNLAAVFADGGHTVLIIDSNFRAARVHRFFDASNHPGLSDYLMGEMRMEETVVKTRRANLWCMPSGPQPRDPCGLLTGRRMDDLLWNMKQRFDYIFMTAPPIREYSDGSALSAVSDHVFLVDEYRRLSSSRILRDKLAVQASGGILSALLLSRQEGAVRPKKAKSTSVSTVRVDVRRPAISQSQEEEDAAPSRIDPAQRG